MSHRNARLTFQGRLLLVRRVRQEGWAVAHAAKAMGISRKCAHYWLKRYDQEGEGGLYDRSSRPHRSPRETSREVAQRIVGSSDFRWGSRVESACDEEHAEAVVGEVAVAAGEAAVELDDAVESPMYVKPRMSLR